MTPNAIQADRTGREIAVIGLACRFPGAANAHFFWQNLKAGIESITFFTPAELERRNVPRRLLGNPNYVKAQAVLEGADLFDAGFFSVNPKEADMMDPQHRLMLECAWEALEDSGYEPAQVDARIGVFAGAYRNAYLDLVGTSDDPSAVFLRNISNECDYLVNRISYKLDLTGPAVTVQTACSTSLVAVHVACESLLQGSCDLGLAGGVTVRAGEHPGYTFEEGGILSSDGHCRAFDADGQGTVIGEGVGLVVLKRLDDAIEDGDTIRALVKGSAVANDGAARVGFTAPGVDGQARLMRAAHTAAGVDPGSISYVETHGSGTPLGDRIELAAMHRAFEAGGTPAGRCAIGSVKTNVGHTHAAAGIAGLIKTVLSLENRAIPPSLNFARPNPAIDWESGRFHVNTAYADWPVENGAPRRAAVSSFGIGGTGAHVVLEEAPPRQRGRARRQRPHLLTISARSEASLEQATDRLAAHLEERPDLDLGDVAYTLQVGRRSFDHRRVLLARDREDAAAALRLRHPTRVHSYVQRQSRRPITFMFSGVGDHYVQMGRRLYESEPVFRTEFDRCNHLLRARSGIDLVPVLYPDTAESNDGSGTSATDGQRHAVDLRRMLQRARPPQGRSLLDETRYAQPAMFTLEYALARQWMAWGVQPDALIGYSIGEYVAACLSGVLTLEDALLLVADRARLIAALPGGSMLAVPVPEGSLRAMLGPEVSLAAVNGPFLCVLAGTDDAIAHLQDRLEAEGVPSKRLPTSHAFHSRMMEPAAAELTELVRSFTLEEPAIPLLSNVTGTWLTADDAKDPTYLARHMCQPVRFAEAVKILWNAPGRVFLEIGPGQALGSLALQARPRDTGSDSFVLASLPSSYDRQPEGDFILSTLGRLWLAGVPVDWGAFHADEGSRRVPLPTYPFERRRHWIEPAPPSLETETKPAAATAEKDIADWFYVPVWEPLPPLASDRGDAPTARWLLFVDECGIGREIGRQLEAAGHAVTVVAAAEQAFAVLDSGEYRLDPRRRADYESLLGALRRSGGLPQRIVQLWTVTAPAETPFLPSEELLQRGFYSLLFLAQALAKEKDTGTIELSVVSNEMYARSAAETSRPEKATLLGPCRVLPQENPHLACRAIDVTLEGEDTWKSRAVTERLVAELLSPVDEPVVSHRGLSRWRIGFRPVQLPHPPQSASRLREGGTYLITGGLGGMGLVLARRLAERARANLVLTSRSGLPPRNEWRRWKEAHGAQDETSGTISQVEEIEALGSHVLVARADVTDFDDMWAVAQEARDRFGPVAGVVHAAGVPGGGLSVLKDVEDARRVLAPKVEGGLVVDALCRQLDVDFLVLCSSVLAVAGGVGQVDYCAGNAFLDALAHRNWVQGGPFTVSVNWDAWREVGMAFRNVGKTATGSTTGAPSPAHPLLDVCTEKTSRRAVYTSRFSVSDTWLIDEHRMLGKAVVPGTGHLEMVRAAYTDDRGSGAVELRDVTFFTPIVVGDDDITEVRVVLEQTGDRSRFTVVSSKEGGHGEARPWQQNSTGTIGPLSSPERRRHDLGGLLGRLQELALPASTGPMGWGRRSQCLHRMYAGDGEFLALIELPGEFSSDLEALALHPSLMDIAASFVGVHFGREFRIPISYGRIQVKAPLPRRIYSYHRYHSPDRPGRETQAADFTIMDEHGEELVHVEEFVLKRAGDLETRLKTVRDGTSREIVPYEFASRNGVSVEGQGFLREGLEQGIGPRDGVEIFDRVVSTTLAPQVLVTRRDLQAVIGHDSADRSRSAKPRGAVAPSTAGSAHPRPNLLTPWVEPTSEMERRLTGLWEDLLGLEQVGVHDNFFDLGGHSLLGIQLASRLRDDFGVNVPLGVLFEALTVAELASVVEVASSKG